MTTSKSHVLWVCQADGTNLKKKGRHYLEKQTERKKQTFTNNELYKKSKNYITQILTCSAAPESTGS